nr:hypothetical protein [Erwinia sp. Ejp617]
MVSFDPVLQGLSEKYYVASGGVFWLRNYVSPEEKPIWVKIVLISSLRLALHTAI